MVHLCKWRVNSKILNPLDGPKRRFFLNAFLRYWAFLERTYNSHSFYAQFQKRKSPWRGGGSFFGGPEGCFCGFIAFWKLRCFPKSTKTLFLASLNLFERRYFAIFIATLRLLFLVFITSLILKGFRRIHQWMMQTLFMIGIWIKRT